MGYFNSVYSSDLPHRARAVYMYLKDRANKDETPIGPHFETAYFPPRGKYAVLLRWGPSHDATPRRENFRILRQKKELHREDHTRNFSTCVPAFFYNLTGVFL